MRDAKGLKIAELAIDVSERTKVQGQWEDRAARIDLVAFAEQAEAVARLRPGDLIQAQAKLRRREINGRNGPYSRTEVLLSRFELLVAGADQAHQVEDEIDAGLDRALAADEESGASRAIRNAGRAWATRHEDSRRHSLRARTG